MDCSVGSFSQETQHLLPHPAPSSLCMCIKDHAYCPSFLHSTFQYFLHPQIHVLHSSNYQSVFALFGLSVQFSRSHMSDFVTPWTAARQASSITNTQCLLKLTTIESVMPSNHLILRRPLLLQSFSASWSLHLFLPFALDGQSIEVSASASVLPMDIQD